MKIDINKIYIKICENQSTNEIENENTKFNKYIQELSLFHQFMPDVLDSTRNLNFSWCGGIFNLVIIFDL